jgi:hypothetical protein
MALLFRSQRRFNRKPKLDEIQGVNQDDESWCVHQIYSEARNAR